MHDALAKKLDKYKWKILAISFLVFLFGVYIWNVFHYNSYWAYDGGGHIEYIYTIALDHHLPTVVQNYLAWHEPLYYLVNGVVAEILIFFGFLPASINKILQLLNSVLAIIFVILSGLLSLVVTKKKGVSLAVLVLTGSLFITSALARYINNEMLFHTLVLGWLVFFFRWKMYIPDNWTRRNWSVLTFGLIILIWVKLTAVVLLLALFLWGILISWHCKKIKFLLVVSCSLLIVFIAYSPWLIYKYKHYGTALTINNYENLEYGAPQKRMPKSFYFHLDYNIFSYPFWTSGKTSFWSMFYASSISDYDNVFENQDGSLFKQTNSLVLVENGRLIPRLSIFKTLLVDWFALPLVLIIIGGCLIYFFVGIKGLFKYKILSKNALLVITAVGFFVALIYNTYRYPFLERGTMKALFILSFFPLIFLFGFSGLQELLADFKYKKAVYTAFVIYLLFWLVLDFYNIILPA